VTAAGTTAAGAIQGLLAATGLSAVVLVTLVQLGSLATDRLTRPAFRRGVDGSTGVVMPGFATALAVEA
jgi:threonine/homoserine/homoserine lactone efflux protein